MLEGASVSYGKATPYLPLIEMLRRYFQLVDGTANESIRDQVVTHILELDQQAQGCNPADPFVARHTRMKTFRTAASRIGQTSCKISMK